MSDLQRYIYSLCVFVDYSDVGVCVKFRKFRCVCTLGYTMIQQKLNFKLPSLIFTFRMLHIFFHRSPYRRNR